MKNFLFIAALITALLISCEQKKSTRSAMLSDSLSTAEPDSYDGLIMAEEPKADSTYAYLEKIYIKGTTAALLMRITFNSLQVKPQ